MKNPSEPFLIPKIKSASTENQINSVEKCYQNRCQFGKWFFPSVLFYLESVCGVYICLKSNDGRNMTAELNMMFFR